MSVAIKVENLSKIYRLGEIGTGTISRDLERWVKMNVLGKEDPFLKIGESNNRSEKGNSDLVYSLQDLNFEIQQGDAVGIIGRNGAGKSTLLKILSRVTTPTTGKVNIKGRVASLLEVGTGFHPELTGRENIYLNGAILGMRKKEIDRKFDEIVDFSGVERYIDTPVKRYSSGMYVRLAFAVAAHLESEILIVDEVLAVGDAEFQKKCLGKMGEISKGEGRTVLFVSHNMGAVQELTDKALLLVDGSLMLSESTKNVIEEFTKLSFLSTQFEKYRRAVEEHDVRITSVEIDNYDSLSRSISESDIFIIKLGIQVIKPCVFDIAIVIEDKFDIPIFTSHFSDQGSCQIIDIGVYLSELLVDSRNLRCGNYKISVAIFQPDTPRYFDTLFHYPCLEIIKNVDSNFPKANDPRWGSIFHKFKWKINENN